MRAPRTMPASTPAPLVLRSFVFQHLEGGQFKIVRAYLSEGVQKMQNSIPMLDGVHFCLCFSCSVALSLLTFPTPPLPECLFCYWGDGLAFSCSVALTFFCASHARWRCDFQLVQRLYCANVCFARGATYWHSRARWRLLFLCSSCWVALCFSSLASLYCANV